MGVAEINKHEVHRKWGGLTNQINAYQQPEIIRDLSLYYLTYIPYNKNRGTSTKSNRRDGASPLNS